MIFRKFLFIAFAISLFFTSCDKSKKLSDAIPTDAAYVIRINSKSLVEKSQYDIFANPTVQQAVNMYKVLLKDEDKVKILEGFLENSNSVGLDLKNELYIYTDYKKYGIVVGVNDADKVKDVLLKLALVQEEDIKKDDNIYLLSPDSNASIAWDDSRLLMLFDITYMYDESVADNESSKSLEELVVEQLKQGSDKSINSNKSYAEFMDEKEDLSIFYSMTGVANMVGFSEIMNPAMKFFAEMEGVSAGVHNSFEKGEMTMSSKYYYDTPETEKKFKSYVDKVAGTLKGDHLKYLTADPFFMVSANIKGDGVYDYMNDWGFVEKINDEFSDDIRSEKIEQLVRNVNGDITFAVTSVKKVDVKNNKSDDVTDYYNDSKTKPEYMFFAEVNNPADFLSLIKEMLDKNETKYKELTPTTYLINEDRGVLYLGVNNNTFFLTNIESVYNNLNATGLKNNYSEAIKGKMFLVSGDIQKMKPIIENEGADVAIFLPLIDEFGKYSMTTSAEDFSGEGKVEFQNKDKNSLAILCEQVDQMITSLVASSIGF